MSSVTVKVVLDLLVKPRHVLWLVTVCVSGVASGTENVSEMLPTSSASPVTSCVPSSHRNVTVPELQ